MSTFTMDYLPFDYVTYTQQILPAFQQATAADEAPLRTILQSLEHISPGPGSLNSSPLSEEATEQLLEGKPFSGLMRLEGLLDVAILRRVRAGRRPLRPWQALARVIPHLKGRSLNTLGRYGEMLHFHLFYTLCSEPPPSPWPDGCPVLPHEEPMRDWQEYTGRDEEMRALWGMFEQSVPEAFAQFFTSRSISPTAWCREHITGFLTPEEAHYLLAHVRTHERPVLDSVLGGCMRDGDGQGWMADPNLPKGEDGEHADYQTIFDYWMRIHPLETKAFEQRYYQNLWQVEAEILHRIRLCVARGWGMIQTCYH